MKLFKRYKSEFETVCKVLSGTVKEIISLRAEKTELVKKLRHLEDLHDRALKDLDDAQQEIENLKRICDEQGERLFDLHADIRDAKAALERTE